MLKSFAPQTRDKPYGKIIILLGKIGKEKGFKEGGRKEGEKKK